MVIDIIKHIIKKYKSYITMSVYKIDHIYQEPIDIILYQWSDYLVPILKDYKITPNMITSFGLLLGIISAILFYHDHYIKSVIIFGISVFLDSCDGHMARKYNMGTEFGKYFDVVSDFIRVGLIYLIMFIKNPDKFYNIFIISAIFLIITQSHLSCQQIESTEGHYLYDKMKKICLGKNTMLLTKYFGPVMFSILVMFFIYTWDN